MKKKLHLPTHPIVYRCISCQSEYQTVSVATEDTIPTCQNCSPFYSGADASEIKSGAVEKENIKARYEEGILWVTIPKVSHGKTHQVEIE